MENGGHPGEKINASKNDDDERKIFIGGLSWETTVKDIKEYFGKFGDVLDATLKTDPMTGRSRGFGFVLFSDVATVDKILQERHNLHGRNIDPKRAKARGGREPILKVFVGGLDPTVPESEIREYFERYGKVTEIDLPFDKAKNQRRAFCFVTFETEAIVDKCCERAKQEIGGKKVDIKKATPKNDKEGWGGGWGGGYGGGWGGGYSGGYGGGYGGSPGGRGGFGGRGRGRGRGGYNQGWGGDQGWGDGYDNYYGNQSYGNQGYDGYSGYGNQGGYDNYDYSGGYYGNQGSWGGGYDSYNYGGGGGYGGGYDYSGWGDGYDGNQGYNKSKGRGGGPSNYHPYSR